MNSSREIHRPGELLEEALFEALRTYSNVHRGSGHKSMVTTALYEHSRHIVLDYLGLNPRKYRVIFCSPYQAEIMEKALEPGSFQILSSASFGLSTGLRAIAVKKGVLPGGAPPLSGGGTTKLISRDWVIWDRAPARFEAGTPPIINVIALARALQLAKENSMPLSGDPEVKKPSAGELLRSDPLEGYAGMELLGRLRKTIIGKDLAVPTYGGDRKFINLDSSASTPALGPVWDAYRRSLFLDEGSGEAVIGEVRGIIADFLGAPPDGFEIIFTSNATEGINMVAGSLEQSIGEAKRPVIVGTLMEHSSNDLPWRNVRDHTLVRIPVDSEGIIDHSDLTTLLEDYNVKERHGDQRVSMVTVSAASNVLGTCNDLKVISEIAHRFGARLMVDGAQLVAHRRIEMDKTGIDYLVCSSHKFYAPFGCGVLVARKGLLRHSQRERKRIMASGEENIAGIAALGKVLNLLGRIGMEVIEKEERELTALALREMQKIEGLKIVGISGYDDEKLSLRVGVIPFNLKNTVSFRVGKELAFQNGIGVRVGCHCAHILVKHLLGVGPGLERFQRIIQTVIPAMSFPGVVRVSLGIENSRDDVEELIRGLNRIASRRKDDGHGVSRGRMARRFSDYSGGRIKKVFGD